MHLLVVIGFLVLGSTLFGGGMGGQDQARQLNEFQEERRRELHRKLPVSDEVEEVDDQEEEELWNNEPILTQPGRVPPSNLKGPPKGSQGVNY